MRTRIHGNEIQRKDSAINIGRRQLDEKAAVTSVRDGSEAETAERFSRSGVANSFASSYRLKLQFC